MSRSVVFGRFPAIGGADAKWLLLNFADPIAELDGVVLTGARLNVFMAIADPDSIPPGQITDLAVTGTGSNWIDAQWLAIPSLDVTGPVVAVGTEVTASSTTGDKNC